MKQNNARQYQLEKNEFVFYIAIMIFVFMYLKAASGRALLQLCRELNRNAFPHSKALILFGYFNLQSEKTWKATDTANNGI